MKRNPTYFLTQFFGQVQQELKKVEWPMWANFVASCGAVLAVVVFFSLYIGVVDKVIALAIDAIFNFFRS